VPPLVARPKACVSWSKSIHLTPGSARGGIDADAFHRGEIDEQSAVADAVAREAVSAAAHRDLQSMRPRKIDGSDDIGCAAAAGDQSRPPVDHAVPNLACRVVGVVTRTQQCAAQTGAEVGDGTAFDDAARRGHDRVVAHRWPPVRVC